MKEEAKLVYLLECLQKTPPPVLIFSENKAEVDNIHEYLLCKGVEAVAIHGGKDQEERNSSIDAFKAGKKVRAVLLPLVSLGTHTHTHDECVTLCVQACSGAS